ncbi:hypothetical protein ACFLZ7_00900 [Nanoarchaeota archaeon]
MVKTCLNNCNYNCMKQLTKKLDFLWIVDTYIKDAERCGHKECAKVFKQMKKDAQAHSDMLKKIIDGKAKKGKLK